MVAGLVGALLWIAWGLAIVVGLIESAQRARWWFVSGAAALFAAVLVLAIQTDVIGDPWVGYCVWALAGIALAPLPLLDHGDRSARRHRSRSPQGERHRARLFLIHHFLAIADHHHVGRHIRRLVLRKLLQVDGGTRDVDLTLQ